MVALGEVEFGEPLSASRLIQESVNVRQRLNKGFGDGVEAPIIVADAPGAVGLACEDN
jgi:hypothetical protein